MHTDKSKPLPNQRKEEREALAKQPTATADQSGLPLPHEHDESHQSQESKPRKIMRQAKEDIDNGIVDTDLRGAYGMGEHEGLQERPVKP